MHSCIYEGRVQHRRVEPIRHEFGYTLYMMYLDLAELDTVFEGRWLWSTRKWVPARFRRSDHLGDPSLSLDSAVRDLVESHCGDRPQGPIRLLTHLRYFGFVANPVSFYYCFEGSGEEVGTVVAEVNNTPWGEQHCYVLRPHAETGGGPLTAVNDKEFHVSPFMGMNQQYHWKLSTPGEQLTCAIASFEQGRKLFDAAMTLHRRPITTRRLARVLCRYPLVTGKVFAGIYWQALRLWWKRCPFYPHPKHLTNPKVTA